MTLLVWIATLFIPSGLYRLDAEGSPIPGTFQQQASPLTLKEAAEQLVLAPVHSVYGVYGVYGLHNSNTHRVDSETVGRMFGQIGVIVFIMSIGAFISVSFATRALKVAVAALADRRAKRAGC